MKSIYYQVVSFFQTMQPIWFITMWLALFATIFIMVVKFFKIYDGTQKNFEKLSLIIGAILLFAVLIFLTCIRK